MIKEVKTSAIFCDCCGKQMKDKYGCNVYFDNICKIELEGDWYRNFYTHKDYCPICFRLEQRECEVDDEYQTILYVVTKDGEEFEYEW